MLRKSILTILIVTITLSLMPPLVFAEDSAENELKPKTVAVFKNGYGFFVSEGEFETENGWAKTGSVPEAALGTFWLGTGEKNVLIEEAITCLEETTKEINAISMIELLKANIGNKVEVIVRPDSSIIAGILKAVPESDSTSRTSSSMYSLSASYHPYSDAQFVLISTDEGDVAVEMSDFIRVKFPENHSTSLEVESKEEKLKFKVPVEAGTATLRASYFRDGISWVPSYLINIDDEKKASLTMKAILINDAEKLENTDVSFVIGYPNFKYAGIDSPLCLGQTLAQFVRTLQRGGVPAASAGAFSNIMTQTVQIAPDPRYYDSGSSDEDRYDYTTIPGLPGNSESDLFVYRKSGVTLDKGERGYYPILTDRVDFQDIYKWDVSGSDSEQQVWHFLRLINSTDHPWTTAPVLVVNDGSVPLSQDTINYTPKKASTDVRLTAAVNVQAESQEVETDREIKKRWYHGYYDLVTLEGELYLKNFTPEKIKIEVTKNLTGVVLESNHEGKAAKDGSRLERLNPNSSVSWEVTLEPGEDITLEYKYRQYV